MMYPLIKKLSKISLVIFLTACNAAITPVPPSHLDLIPTLSPTLSPTQTPTPQPTFTLLPPPTVDPIFFRDEFNGNLEPGWTWMREVPEQWSLTAVNGSLQIDASHGYVNWHTITNVLLRPAPVGDFEIETKLTFSPQDNYQFAGLIIYNNDSNFLEAGRAYCRGGGCFREGIYMNYYRRGVATLPNFGQPYRQSNAVILRLIRKGAVTTFIMSADGIVFYALGEIVSDMDGPLQVGLIAGQNIEGEIIPALFEYFEITSPQ